MTETKVDFALTDVVREVRALANQNPEFVYRYPGYDGADKTCYYLHGENRDQPGCIIGQALGRLGFVVPVDWEGTHAGEVMARLFGFDWNYDGTDPGVPDEARWLRAVQSHQDERAMWGAAVARADAAFSLEVPA